MTEGIEKSALYKTIADAAKKFLANKALSMPVLSAGNAAFWDAANYSDSGIPFAGEWNKERLFQALANAAVGGAAHHVGTTSGLGAGLGTALLSPAKDLMIRANSAIGDIQKNPLVSNEGGAVTDLVDSIKNEGSSSTGSSIAPWLIGGGLGLAGITAGGIALNNYLNKKRDEEKKKDEEKSQKALVRVRIPGADGDMENATELELPVDAPEVSKALNARIGTAARRALGREAKYSGFKKDPVTGKKIPYADYVALYGTEAEKKERADAILASMPKYASAPQGAPQPASMPNQGAPPPPPPQSPDIKLDKPVQPNGVVPQPALTRGATDGAPAEAVSHSAKALQAKIERLMSKRMA